MQWCDQFIRRPVLASALSLLLVLLGLQAFYKMPVREYPQLTHTVITVTTNYYGASAELIQGMITAPLEQAIANTNHVDYITSQSLPGMSVITVSMKINSNADAALAEVLSRINSVRSQLPKEAEDPMLERSGSSSTSILYLGFTSETLKSSQITDYLQRVIRPQLLAVNGIAKVGILGGQQYALRVWIDPQKLGALGVTLDQVVAQLQANNYQSATGQWIGHFIRYYSNADTQVRTLEELKALVIAAPEGALVRLQDVAEVSLDQSHDRYRVSASGQEAVIIGIDGEPNANPITVAHEVRQLLPILERTMLSSIKMTLLYDSTTAIDAAIDQVIKALLEASAIVLVVILLFLGRWRAVLIPLVTIPLSLLGGLFLMQLCGFTINLLTLLAMVLAIGLVVDDAIVVLENIERHIQSGQSPFRAAVIGIREMALPVITMTITLAAVYAPIAFLGGLTGALFQEFALTLSGAVLISGLVALTLSPMMCAHWLTPHQPTPFEQQIQHCLQRLTDGYERALHATLAQRPVLLTFALVVLLSLPLLAHFIPQELAPAEDRGVVMLIGNAPASANLDAIQQSMRPVDAILKQQPEIAFSQLFSGMPAANQALGMGVMTPWNERTTSQKALIARITPLLQSIPEIAITVFQRPELPGSSLGLPLQFVMSTAQPFENLHQVAQVFLAKVQENRQFAYSQLDLHYDTATIEMTIDRDKAAAYGVTMQAIGKMLATLVTDGALNRVELDGQSYEVIVQVERQQRLDPSALQHYFVPAADGRALPLSTLISSLVVGKPRALSHFNQLNAATISVVLAPGLAMGEAIEWFKSTANQQLPQGYRYDFTGEARQFISEGQVLYLAFIMALLVIYLVLAMQFESLRDPLVILVAVPLALSGALIAMAWGAATLNIYSQIGLITLIGLISKHGILIATVAKTAQLEQGLDRQAAVLLAAKLRLRPIVMTTAAMVAGSIPLLFSTGAGAAARFSIGLVMVTGLTLGTLFTLFILPVIYTLLASQHRPLPQFIEE
jgi:multidrug efflux pump